MTTAEDFDPIVLLERLIAIDSVNPDLVPGAAGEARIAAFCAEWLARHGLEVHSLGSRVDRPSVVGVARGTGGGRSLLLNGHLDTVSVTGYEGSPFVAVRRGGRIFGRGAFDMKSGLAAIMVAGARAASARLRGDVLVACVADEEFGSVGTEDVLGRFTADAAIVAEPTGLDVTLAHRGFAWFDVGLTGRAAHGSMPDQGVDAIRHAGRLMAALDELERRIEAAPRHPLLGHGAVRVATIRGGSDAATVAAECRLTVERRTLPGETPDEVEAELRSLLHRLFDGVPGLGFTLERRIARAAFDADPSWPIVTALLAQAERVLGARPTIRGEPFWTDAGLLDQAGIPCLLIGVAGGGAHADEEWVDAQSVHRLTELLTGTIAEFCA
jgi:acetylornithine deacetylase